MFLSDTWSLGSVTCGCPRSDGAQNPAAYLTHTPNRLLNILPLSTSSGYFHFKMCELYFLWNLLLLGSLCKQNHPPARHPIHPTSNEVTPLTIHCEPVLSWWSQQLSLGSFPASRLPSSIFSTAAEAVLTTLLLKTLHPFSRAFKAKFKSSWLTMS